MAVVVWATPTVSLPSLTLVPSKTKWATSPSLFSSEALCTISLFFDKLIRDFSFSSSAVRIELGYTTHNVVPWWRIAQCCTGQPGADSGRTCRCHRRKSRFIAEFRLSKIHFTLGGRVPDTRGRAHDDKERTLRVPKDLGRSALQVALASAIMSVSQYVEMGLTHRAPSDLPIRLVEAIVKRQARPGFQREAAGELGQGALAAIALASANVMRSIPMVAAIALNALIMSLGNAAAVRVAGLGGMPWTWSNRELVIDLTHKTVLSMATRAIVERQHPAKVTSAH
jgi:hypothetical protein